MRVVVFENLKKASTRIHELAEGFLARIARASLFDKSIVIALKLCLDCTGTLGVIASLLEVGDGSACLGKHLPPGEFRGP
jgi:hypothetical protein